VLYFEVRARPIESLRLQVPAGAWEEEGWLRMQIPANMILRG
jgi:hypothetical protein